LLDADCFESDDCMEQIIYLDPTDDLPVIRDRLEWAQSKRVLLVLPQGYRPLRNVVGLRLLLRHAAALEMEIALVTRDRMIAELAREKGIIVFSSVERGQRATKLTRPDATETGLPGGAQSPRSAVLMPQRKASGLGRWGQMGVVLVLVGVVGLLLLGVALVVLPSAEITIHLPTVELSETIPIQADVNLKQMQPITSAIPARDARVEVRGSERTNVNSQKDMPDTKAQGEVVFTNKTDSEVVLPPNLVVATSTGVTVRFQTLETVTVPAGIGAKIVAKIEALEPGPSGNVRAFVINRIEGLAAMQVSAVNEKPASGGSVRSVLVVGNEDKARVRSLLLQRLQQEALAELKAEMGEQEILLPETMVLIPINELYDKFVDEVANELSVNMTVVVRALAISGKDANALALGALEAKVPQGMALVPRTLRFQPGEVKDFQDNRVVFMMAASGTAAPVADEAALVQAIQGKTVAWAAQYLEEQLGLKTPAEIRLRSAWTGRLPWLSFRISLRTLMPEE